MTIRRVAPLSIAIVAALAATLGVLAVLQYRWIGQVSEADRERMRIGLDNSVAQFRQEFYRELLRVSTSLRTDPGALDFRNWRPLADRYDEWMRTSSHPELLAGLFVWTGGTDLLRLDPATDRLVPSPWPPQLDRLRERLEAQMRELNAGTRRDVRYFAWTMDERVPALHRSLVEFTARDEHGAPFPRVRAYLVAELSLDYLRKRLLPELARRHFPAAQGFSYRVEATGREGAARLLYQSDPAEPAGSFAAPDAKASLLGEPLEDFFRATLDREFGSRAPVAGRRVPLRTPPVILVDSGEVHWQLLVRHRSGSLDAVVVSLRRRNLAVSFSVLLLLAVSMALILVSTQRAKRLARLQIDFVAGVSHELRTPLSVIRSAADNLADGVVAEHEQARRYGELIRNEGRRLTGMVEQILLYAATQAGRCYDLRPVDVDAAVAAVLDDATPVANGVGLEARIADGLPPVMADEGALKQCLRNLVANAMKYGAAGGCVLVGARLADGPRTPEILISVKDKGPGIEPADLRHIFEPFYRGKAARESQIHGTGLGLSLAKDIAEGMGGRITVESAPGKGSVFTLHLPAAPDGTAA